MAAKEASRMVGAREAAREDALLDAAAAAIDGHRLVLVKWGPGHGWRRANAADLVHLAQWMAEAPRTSDEVEARLRVVTRLSTDTTALDRWKRTLVQMSDEQIADRIDWHSELEMAALYAGKTEVRAINRTRIVELRAEMTKRRHGVTV
jgi:hypothetical protein